MDALEAYCLNVPFANPPSLPLALLLSAAYVQGGAPVFGDDTKKLMRLFDQWLTSTVCCYKCRASKCILC